MISPIFLRFRYKNIEENNKIQPEPVVEIQPEVKDIPPVEPKKDEPIEISEEKVRTQNSQCHYIRAWLLL